MRSRSASDRLDDNRYCSRLGQTDGRDDAPASWSNIPNYMVRNCYCYRRCNVVNSHSVTAILPPLVVHLQNLRGLRHNISCNDAEGYIRTCLRFLQMLGQVHWHASFYHQIFELAAFTTSERQSTSAMDLLENPATNRPSDDIDPTGPKGRHSKRLDVQQSMLMDGLKGMGTDELTHQDLTFFEPLQWSALDGGAVAEGTGSNSESLNISPSNLLELDEEALDSWLNEYAALKSFFPSV